MTKAVLFTEAKNRKLTACLLGLASVSVLAIATGTNMVRLNAKLTSLEQKIASEIKTLKDRVNVISTKSGNKPQR